MKFCQSFPDFIFSNIDLLRDRVVITDHWRELSYWGATMTHDSENYKM